MITNSDSDRLNAAVKADDSAFTTYLVSPYSRYIVAWAARRSLTPNQITVVSLAIGVAAAGAFAVGSGAGMIVGALLLQVSFVADCVDGQLARYTGHLTPLGAWLDATFDRAKEYIVFAGLALGAARGGAGDAIWLLAAAAMALQTVRHILLFSYTAETSARSDEAAPAASPGARRSVLSRVTQSALLPIGERFAVISVAAVVAGARATFVVLLVWGGAGLLYQAAGRLARSVAA